MPFNINKCQILQVGFRNIKKDYEMRGVKIKSVHSVKDLGVKVRFFLQVMESVIKANRMMGLIKRNFSIKNKDVALPLWAIIILSNLVWNMPRSFDPRMQKTVQEVFSVEQPR